MSERKRVRWPAEKESRSLPPFLLVVFLGLSLSLLTGVVVRGMEPDSGPTAGEETITLYFPVIASQRPLSAPASGPIYGLNFISSAEAPADEQQYQNGLSTGARWNRWPIYWFYVEQEPGKYDWSAQDATVQADIAHGLKINAILLGTPGFYSTSLGQRQNVSQWSPPPGTLSLQAMQAATPVGLYEPVFSDGSDKPGPGKQINPDNVWARFVYAAVNRYKPGGVLARQNGWGANVGITHWEMWNEPDLPIFWNSSLPDYARLLKVGYLATKQADPAAQVLFGALANNFEKLNYYEDVLKIYDEDTLAAGHNYYHDILATHSYFVSWRSWYHVWRARNTMGEYGLDDKPVWFNESGVPAWNDYPGPVWDPESPLRATMSEQADYVIQSAFYATFAGADAVFHFQLYDGCGNQPAGTDFPPHNGGLCDENGFLEGNPGIPCAGDANGLFRNPTDAVCFRQHPQPETPRPNFAAFRVLTNYLTDVVPLWRQRPGSDDPYNGPQEWIAFYRPATGERIVGMWSRVGAAQTAVVPAANSAGTGFLVAADGTTQTVTAQDGFYTIQLPAATNQNAPWDPESYAIGGRPYILIEPDTTAPQMMVEASLSESAQIEVNWRGTDGLDSDVAAYEVQVSIDGGPAIPWLAYTTAETAVYEAEPGHAYTFVVIGRDRAGNASDATAVTVVTDGSVE